MYNFVSLLHSIVALYTIASVKHSPRSASYNSAVALLSDLCFRAVLYDFGIVRFDDRSHILHAAVTNFGVIAIKCLM